MQPSNSNNQRSRCATCGSVCGRDRHHAIWPKIDRKRYKRKITLSRFPGCIDTKTPAYSSLRIAPFMISSLICRRYHDKIHAHQRYPTPQDLPHRKSEEDINNSKLQYINFSQLEDAVSRSMNNLTSTNGDLLALEKDAATIHGKLGLLEGREILFPTLGYYCLTNKSRYSLSRPLPVLHDTVSIIEEANEVLEESIRVTGAQL